MDDLRHGGAPVPPARLDGLVITETDDAVLLYDTGKHHIHHLNATAAAVWRLLDGRHTLADLVRLAGHELGTPADTATVRLALTKLDDAGLLRTPLPNGLRMTRMSRRTLLRGVGAAGVVAIPAIASTTAPAAAAQISTGCSCESDSDCGGPCSPWCDTDGVCKSRQCGSKCGGSDECADLAACTECRDSACQEPQGGEVCDAIPCKDDTPCTATCPYCVNDYCSDNACDKTCDGSADCPGTKCPDCVEGFCGALNVCDNRTCKSDAECTVGCPDCLDGYCGTLVEVCGTIPCKDDVPCSETCPYCVNDYCHGDVCGRLCSDASECISATCPYCSNGICSSQDIETCDSRKCGDDDDCPSAACPDCVAGTCGNRVEVCNQECTGSEYCANGTDGCTACQQVKSPDGERWECRNPGAPIAPAAESRRVTLESTETATAVATETPPSGGTPVGEPPE